MASQYFQCPKCATRNAIGSRFCSNCGIAYVDQPTVKKASLPGWAIAAILMVGLCGVCSVIGNLTDKNKKLEAGDVSKTEPATSAGQPAANIQATPTPPPTFAELKTKSESLLKFQRDEYSESDLKQFDEAMIPLREIPKTAKEYKEAQALNKKLIDKVSVIAAEVLVLGPKPKNSEWDARVDPVVTYLKANLNDYEDSEWLEWSPVAKINIGKEPYWAVRLKLRAKNGFGGKIVKDVVFFIRQNRVVKTTGL